MLRRLLSASGIAIAPVTYLLGRLLQDPSLAAKSIDFDYDFLRGYRSLIQRQDVQSEMFERLIMAAKLSAYPKASIDAAMMRMFPNSHGQLLQDVVCALVHGEKRDGYFVEVGVGDGTKFSNTLLLERDFGWRGILAEPATGFHESIRTSRTAILDPRAAHEETGKILLFEQDESMGELSGLAGQRTVRGEQTLLVYKVETVRLDDLLTDHGAPDEIDYVSIDTEGSEQSVLDGLSLSNRRVWFFSIEHNFDPLRMRSYDELLEPAGYKKLLPNLSSFDSWYIHRDLASSFLSNSGMT